MTTTFIYGLFDPITNKLRYVGKTNNPSNRLRQHVYAANHYTKKNTHVLNWVRKLLRNGEKPKLKVLEEVSINNWQEAEVRWIDACRNLGIDLVNTTEGGRAPVATEETRRKISESKKGRHHSEETKRKIALKSMGRQANLGNRHTQETKEKISLSKKGRKSTPEHIKNAIDGRKGYRHSEETKAKISKSNSIANKGKKHSEEHKQRISEGVRKSLLRRMGMESS